MTEPTEPLRAEHTDSSFSLGTARISSVGHLTTEAIAAYVDGELRMGPHLRASAHLGGCPTCAAEVEAQRTIRADLRHCPKPAMPDSLLGLLRAIPNCPSRSEDGGAFAGDQGEDPQGAAGRGRPRWRWPF